MGNIRIAVVIGAAILLLASNAASIGFAGNKVALGEESTFTAEEVGTGNYIINYIYEIELEDKDSPRIELDEDLVKQNEAFSVNGSNFDSDSTVAFSIFDEHLLSITNEDGDLSSKSAAVILTEGNLTMSKDGGGMIIESAQETGEGDEGTIVLATNIHPTDASSEEYDVSLECDAGPDDDAQTSFEFSDRLVMDDQSSKQFFELSLPTGDYEGCQVMITSGDEGIESSAVDLLIVSDDRSNAVDGEDTDDEGSFMQDVTVSSDAEDGRYVLMAETDEDDDVKQAIARLEIGEEGTTIAADGGSNDSSVQPGAGGNNSGSSGNTGSGGTGGNNSGLPGGNNNNGSGNNGGSSGGNNTGGTGGTGGGNNGGGTGGGDPSGGPGSNNPPPDECQDVGPTGNVNNTIAQSTSQSGSNTYTDNDVINITQTITGTYNGSGHVNTNIAVDNSNTVTQGVNQNIDQDASIRKCGEAESGAAGNQTNTIDMNATQLASNAYSDDTTIIIIQTIIIPKSCDTNVDAPVSISDRNAVTQTANQHISQEADIAYGGSGGEGSNTNTATQVSMQVAANNATNDEVITINQVIIVPPECPAQVQAPIVIEGNNNVNMTVSQTAVQDAEINANGGVAIVSTVSGTGQPAYTTNTVIMSGSQGAQNTFSDDDTIIIQQNIYYVNDTAGWTEESYEENLAEEFGGSPGNTTSPVTEDPPGAGNSTSGETLAPIDTGGGDEIEPAPGPSNSTEPVSEEIVAADPSPEENPGDIEPPADTTEEIPSDPVESTGPAVDEAVSEQPVVEETVEPTVPEDTPEANTTDSVSEDPSPVESQDASTPEGNSTSVA